MTTLSLSVFIWLVASDLVRPKPSSLFLSFFGGSFRQFVKMQERERESQGSKRDFRRTTERQLGLNFSSIDGPRYTRGLESMDGSDPKSPSPSSSLWRCSLSPLYPRAHRFWRRLFVVRLNKPYFLGPWAFFISPSSKTTLHNSIPRPVAAAAAAAVPFYVQLNKQRQLTDGLASAVH